MNKELALKKHYCFFLLALSSLLLTTVFRLEVNAQDLINSPSDIDNKVICKIQFNDTSYESEVDRTGYFQRITNVPSQATVLIEITYPACEPGEKAFISAIDGGRLDSGKAENELALDNQKKLSFSFQVTRQYGLNRVYVKKGKNENIVRLWVGNEQTATGAKNNPKHVNGNRQDISPHVQNHRNASITDADVTGNNNVNGVDAPCKGADCASNNSFDPYTGNAHREVKDLEVWGAVGDVPLVWKRYYNSRGFYPYSAIGQKWNYSFNFSMAYINIDGKQYLKVYYPEGGNNTFYRPGIQEFWSPDPGVGKRVFEDENIFTLQMENGTRYHFERFEKFVNGQRSWYFQLKNIQDARQNLLTLEYDDNGNLSRISEPAGRFLDLTYELIGEKKHLTRVTTSDGRSVDYNYKVIDNLHASAELLDAAKYGDGTYAKYEYEFAPRMGGYLLIKAFDPRVVGNKPVIRYKYNNDLSDYVGGYIEEEQNGLTGEMMGRLSVRRSDYSPDEARIVTYANCKREFFNLPASMQGRLDFHIDGLERKTQYTYGSDGFVNTITDASGRTTTSDVVSVYGNPLEVTYADGSKEKWDRGDLDLVRSHRDENGNLTSYSRDANNRINDIYYMDLTSEHFTYNDFGQVRTHTRRNKAVEESEYDNKGLLKSFTDASGNVTHFTYYNSSLPESVTDALGNTTRYEYNERGLMTKLTHGADGSFQEYGYDDFGNQTSITNEVGNTWTTTYDEFDRIKSTIDPLNRKTEFSYDLPGGACGCGHPFSKPTKTKLPSGKVIENEYNEEWEIVRQTVAGGKAGEEANTYYEYDLAGNLATMVDPNGNQLKYGYTARNRLAITTDPLGHVNIKDYDFAGNVVTDFRADNSNTRYEYDEMNRVKKITDPKRQVTEMTYDAEGNIKTLTDPKKNKYSFEYDALNRKKKTIHPDQSFETYTYDSVGNLKTYTNIAGEVETYKYDNRNREVLCYWNTNTPPTYRTYDAANRLVKLINSVSSLSYTYNEANELTTETQYILSAFRSKKISYTYNADGLRESLTYPNGSSVSYSYTLRNQLQSISTPQNKIVEYDYDANGNRINKALQNGTYTDYSYDEVNRLLHLNNWGGSGRGRRRFAWFDYGYDPLNRRTFVRRNYDPGNPLTSDMGDVYSYDAIDQITEVQYDVTDPGGTKVDPKRTVNYEWDSTGNRTTVTDNGLSTAYSTNNLNQYTSTGVVGENAGAGDGNNHGQEDGNDPSKALVEKNLAYSKNGNLEAYNDWTYEYDAQNRLIKAQKADTTVTFAYDPLDRCVNRTVNGASTSFYYDGWSLIEEDANNEMQAAYVHGADVDELLARISSSADTVFYHHNELGSVTQLTDKQGKVVEEYAYDIFGAPTITSNGEMIGASAYGNRFMFTGREYIQEFGLYDYRSRTYSPTLGRFLQRDPIGFDAGDQNLYRYAGNNSVNLSDPFGFDPEMPVYETVVYANPCKNDPTSNECKVYLDNERWSDEFVFGLDKFMTGLENEDPARDGLIREDPVGDILMYIAGGVAFKGLSKGLSSLFAKRAANLAAKEGTKALIRTGTQLSKHALERLAQRGVTQNMVELAISKGQKFYDPLNKSINYVLPNGFASGKSLLVGTNPFTGEVTTVIRSSKNLIRPRMVPIQ